MQGLRLELSLEPKVERKARQLARRRRIPEKVKALTIRDEYGISHAYNIYNTN